MGGGGVGDEFAGLATPLRTPADLDPLIQRIGAARFVLLGEASHGTHEYYRWRSEITKRLIEELGFSFVAVEGDWPACLEVNAWVRGLDQQHSDRGAEQVLSSFQRWPTWMWANREVVELITWLRARNAGAGRRLGFYGLDVYSLWESLDAIVGYLSEHEPEAVEVAMAAFRCFEPYGENLQAYGRATRLVPTSCEDELVELLMRICEDGSPGAADPELRFAAEQNAAVARSAEHYYRAMMGGGTPSWNVRDTHMVDTLDRLMEHHGPGARAIVWAHNTHIGDARATDMAASGLVNVGQLVRERHGADQVVVVGFGTHRGAVVASREWGAQMERMGVPAASEGSAEDLLHREIGADALLVWRGEEGPGWLDQPRPHRAIGVVYRPERERWGNYVPTILGQRYDAFLYFEDTGALRPLGEEAAGWPDEAPQTFPFGV